MFVGYSFTQSVYLCLNHSSSKIYTSRHVKFVEFVFPFKSIHGHLSRPSLQTLPNWFPPASFIPTKVAPHNTTPTTSLLSSDQSHSHLFDHRTSFIHHTPDETTLPLSQTLLDRFTLSDCTEHSTDTTKALPIHHLLLYPYLQTYLLPNHPPTPIPWPPVPKKTSTNPSTNLILRLLSPQPTTLNLTHWPKPWKIINGVRLLWRVQCFCSEWNMGTCPHWINAKYLVLHHDTSLSLHVFFDPDWAGNKDDYNSTSAYIVYLGHNPISWSSKKQRMIARSSTEAKYRVVASTAAELRWLCSLLTELGFCLSVALVIYYDNVGATHLCSNPMFHSRMNHVALDFHFIRDQVQVEPYMSHISSKDQLADVLTKPLPRTRFL